MRQIFIPISSRLCSPLSSFRKSAPSLALLAGGTLFPFPCCHTSADPYLPSSFEFATSAPLLYSLNPRTPLSGPCKSCKVDTMRLQLGRPLSESLPRVHSSSLSVGLRWSPSPHGTCPAAAPVLRQARLASYRTARTCKKPATARRHRSCRASAASPVSASEAPAEATAAAEPASSTNPGTTSLDDIPPAEAEQAASSEPSGSESPEHDLPFNVGDNVVGCVVRNSRLGAHVRLSTHNGLLG